MAGEVIDAILRETWSDQGSFKLFSVWEDHAFSLGVVDWEIQSAVAIDVLAGVTKHGRGCYAGYLLIERMLKVLRDKYQIDFFDYGAVDPVNNKSVYKFKLGSGGVMVPIEGEYKKSGGIVGSIASMLLF